MIILKFPKLFSYFYIVALIYFWIDFKNCKYKLVQIEIQKKRN